MFETMDLNVTNETETHCHNTDEDIKINCFDSFSTHYSHPSLRLYSIHLYSLLILPFLFSSLLHFSFLRLCFCSAHFFHVSHHSFFSSCPRISLNILFIISRNENNCWITLNKIIIGVNS